jgi:hypothetical protein
LACFGFGELGLKNQEKGENSIKTINSKQDQARHIPRCFIFITT